MADNPANLIYHGDSRDILPRLPEQSAQTVITSPPYWALRDYSLGDSVWDGDPQCDHQWVSLFMPPKGGKNKADNPPNTGGNRHMQSLESLRGTGITSSFCEKCGAWKGTLGHEPVPEMYVEHLVYIFNLIWPVLRDDGCVWLNLGDSYFGGGFGTSPGGTDDFATRYPRQASNLGTAAHETREKLGALKQRHPILKAKDLCGIPERVQLRLQEEGWFVRCKIPWIKVNAMPGPWTDRPLIGHEYVLLLSKKAKYYFDMNAITVPYDKPLNRWGGDNLKASGISGWNDGTGQDFYRDRNMRPNENGRKRRTSDWWYQSRDAALMTFFSDEFMALDLPTQPFELELCEGCDTVYNKSEYTGLKVKKEKAGGKVKSFRVCEKCGKHRSWMSHFATFSQEFVRPMILASTPEDGIVLDPFAGSGTTCAEAKRLGRQYIGIEPNAQYVMLAERRIEEVSEEPEERKDKRIGQLRLEFQEVK